MCYLCQMFDFTPLARPIFAPKIRACRSWVGNSAVVQRRELEWLLRKGLHTLIGEKYGFRSIRGYDDFASRVPVMPYGKIRGMVMDMISGGKDILWPGVTRSFAQSSGTSDGKSKYIPVTRDSFSRQHYRGGSYVVASYLDLYPDSRLFSGKAFILGGSFSNELSGLPPGVRVGDLSANLIANINPLANAFRVPSKDVALMSDWEEKLPALTDAAIGQDITNISGVPSWFLTLLRSVIAKAGASTIHDVWPNLEVFFHGGIAFGPYREQYRAITDSSKMRYLETYNASEGFFAVQTDREDSSMQLLLDAGTFYEFVPAGQADEEFPEAVPVWKVEEGETYALVITACNGLWRYPLGDTVTVKSVDPLKIVIAGRTKHYINAFGEELMVHNADAAITRACGLTGAKVANYTAAPVYTTGSSRGHHQWLIEFTEMPEGGLEVFADTLDRCLQQENSDYQAKRTHDIFLARLKVEAACEGLFDRWLASTGKLGGQRKVPRLCNDRHFIEPMLDINRELHDMKNKNM